MDTDDLESKTIRYAQLQQHLQRIQSLKLDVEFPKFKQMLHELADENQGLQMNKSKTKVMMENDLPIYVNNTEIENVESYMYLAGTPPDTKTKKRRFKEESRPGGQHSPSTGTSSRVTIGTCLKRQVYNSCILPAMIYGAERWALTTQAKNKLAAAQTKFKGVC